jgi:ketosteroid isomerase-like protein
VPAHAPEQVDHLLAEAFNAQDLDACVALYDPDASVVRLDVFGGTVAKGDQGIREVIADYVGLKPHMDVAIHHVTHAGDYALVRSQWRITGTGRDGKPIELHHHGMEVMRRQPNGEWRFFIDHPYGADASWEMPADRLPASTRSTRS